MADDDGVDWGRVDLEMARQIASQGEKYLQTQVQMAIAADQRAMTLAGLFTAIATAVIAASIAYWDKSGSAPILAAGVVGGVVMLIGAASCLWSARQIDFYYPGNEPAHWYAQRYATLTEAIGGEAENYQHHIEKNDAAIKANGRFLGWGAKIAVAAPIVGLVVWALASCPSFQA
jgi:hypothetical protein